MQRILQIPVDYLQLLVFIQHSGVTRYTLPSSSSRKSGALKCLLSLAPNPTPPVADFSNLSLKRHNAKVSSAWIVASPNQRQWSSPPWGCYRSTIAERAVTSGHASAAFAGLSFAAQYERRTLTTSRAHGDGFSDLNVFPDLQERLTALGILEPLPVQEAAVPAILAGQNVAIKSCTGSGKTLAYLLPVIQLAWERREAVVAATGAATAALSTGAGMDMSHGGRPSTALKLQTRALQALIVAPSRELCIQIQRTAQELLPSSADRRLVQQLIGGANPRRQAEALSGRDGGVWPLLAVGTPGRVAEFVGDGKLHVWGCPLLVLDEVDQLLEQYDTRRHVDTICAHVGRRVAISTAPADSRQDPRSVDVSGGSNNASGGGWRRSPIGSGGSRPSDHKADDASGAVSGRQTVIISASLDGRCIGNYAPWCPSPTVIMLQSNQALPRRVLQMQQPADARLAVGQQGGPKGGQGEVESQGWIGRAGELSCSSSTDAAQEPPVREPAVAAGGSEPTGTDGASAGAQPSGVDGSLGHSEAGPLSGVLPPHLAHIYVVSPSQHRTDHVRRLIHALDLERVLLFVPKQNQAMVTKYRLEARRMQVTILHGQLSKLERGNIVDAFRRGLFRALVVTDLGARGLDLPDCDGIINFGVPSDALAYAHRAGRTGRAGAPGVVASVVSKVEVQPLQRIARRLGLRLQAVAISHGSIAPGEDTAATRGAPGSNDEPRKEPFTPTHMALPSMCQ